MGAADGEDDERPSPTSISTNSILDQAAHQRGVLGLRPGNRASGTGHLRRPGCAAGGRWASAPAPPGNYVWLEAEPAPDRLQHPVTLVRWDDAVAYCNWLSNTTGRTVRLPRAEWEKAARGGLESKRYSWGDRLDRNMANFLTDPTLKALHGTTRCGSYPPNGFGLFDVRQRLGVGAGL